MAPGDPSAGPAGKAATLGVALPLVLDAEGRLLSPHPGCILPVRRASRLDEPPESRPSA